VMVASRRSSSDTGAVFPLSVSQSVLMCDPMAANAWTGSGVGRPLVRKFLISNLQGGHALRQGRTGREQQQAVGAEGSGDAFA
jgi:hypothetical protein